MELLVVTNRQTDTQTPTQTTDSNYRPHLMLGITMGNNSDHFIVFVVVVHATVQVSFYIPKVFWQYFPNN